MLGESARVATVCVERGDNNSVRKSKMQLQFISLSIHCAVAVSMTPPVRGSDAIVMLFSSADRRQQTEGQETLRCRSDHSVADCWKYSKRSGGSSQLSTPSQLIEELAWQLSDLTHFENFTRASRQLSSCLCQKASREHSDTSRGWYENPMSKNTSQSYAHTRCGSVWMRRRRMRGVLTLLGSPRLDVPWSPSAKKRVNVPVDVSQRSEEKIRRLSPVRSPTHDDFGSLIGMRSPLESACRRLVNNASLEAAVCSSNQYEGIPHAFLSSCYGCLFWEVDGQKTHKLTRGVANMLRSGTWRRSRRLVPGTRVASFLQKERIRGRSSV